jgi:hypothetical protein
MKINQKTMIILAAMTMNLGTEKKVEEGTVLLSRTYGILYHYSK